MKCSECNHRNFERQPNGIGRHYCKHPTAAASVNGDARLICKTERGGSGIQVKTAPRWCPLKYNKEDENHGAE